MLVVPAEDQKAGKDVAVQFFKLTYGSLGTEGSEFAQRLLYAFMAISSLGTFSIIALGMLALILLGNIIVMTYTAARGMLDCPLIFE